MKNSRAGRPLRPSVSKSTAEAVARLAGAVFLCLAASISARGETLTLEQCLRETVEHNPAIRVQATEMEAAAGTRLVLRSRALPQAQITGLLGQQGAGSDATLRVPQGVFVNGKQVSETVVQKRPSSFILIGSEAVYQPVFDVGIPANWRRGNLETATAEQNYYSVAVTQLYLARLYFNLALYQRESGTIFADIDRALAANIKAVEPLVQAGLIGRQALLQAQTQRANFTPLINTTTSGYRGALTMLLTLMGRDQRQTGHGDLVAGVRLEGAFDDAAFTFDPHTVAAHALAHRPDLESLRSLIRSFQEDARTIRAGYYPLVRVFVTGDLLPQSFQHTENNNALRSGDQVRTTEIRPGVRYDWSVIDTGTVSGGAQAIDRSRESVAASLHQLELSIPSDLSRLRAQLDDAAATIRSLKVNVTAAQDTLNIVAGTVAQGTGTQLEFNEAQSELLNARSSLLTAQYSATSAVTDFDRVAGNYLRFVTTARSGGTASQSSPAK